MEDSEEEDPIEELCEYLDLKVEQYCEDEHIPVKEASVFQNICYEYKKKLRKGTIRPPMTPQSAFREISELFHEHQVAEQLMNEDIDSYKNKDKEWTAHVKSVLTELNDIFHKATIKHPDMLNSRNSAYKAISETMKEFILKFKNQQTIPTDGIDLWKTILYSLEKDQNGEVQQAARKRCMVFQNRKRRGRQNLLHPHHPSSQTRKPGLWPNSSMFWVNIHP